MEAFQAIPTDDQTEKAAGSTAAAKPAKVKIRTLADFDREQQTRRSRQPAAQAAAPVSSLADFDRMQEERSKSPGLKLKEYLFGKKEEPAGAGGGIQAKDTGVVGKLWGQFMQMPTGTGKTFGEVTEGIFNPVGRTDIQQSRMEGLQEKSYQEQFGGRSTGVRALASVGTGVGRFVEGQTSPFQMALLFAGPVKAIAAEGAAIPYRPVMATLGKLAHFGFTAQMATGAVDDARSSVQQFSEGNWEQGIQLSISGMTNALFAVTGTTHARAQETVRRSLESNAQQIYKAPWTKLSPEQQANVVYEAARKMPFYAELEKNHPNEKIFKQMERANKARADYIERAKEEGLRPPPVGETLNFDEVQEQHEAGAKQRVEGSAGINAALEGEVDRRRAEHRVALEKEYAHDQIDIAQKTTAREQELRGQQEAGEKERAAEAAALTSPVRTVVDRRAVGDAIPESERAEAQAAARRVLEDERARRMREKEEAGFGVTDRRAAATTAESLRQEIEQRGKLETEAGRRYQNAQNQLTELVEQIYPGAGPETVYERLRRKQREGFGLSREEEGFLGLYAQRESFERDLMRDTKLRGATAADRQDRNLESLRALTANAEKETDLREAARTLHEQATRAKSPEEADVLSQEAIEAEQMAERLRTEQEHERIHRDQVAEPKEFEELGAPVSRLEGRPTWIDLPDGRALPAQYGAVRLSDLLRTQEGERSRMRPEQYDPGYLVSTDTSAQHGPVTVLNDGRLVNGSRRLGMLSEALRGPDRDRVLQEIEGQLWRFGVEVGDGLDRSDPYIPVRILDSEPRDAESYAILQRDLDRTVPVAITADLPEGVEKQNLPSWQVQGVIDKLKELPEGSTLGDLLASREGPAILDEMVSNGVLDQHSAEEFLTESGELTESGRNILERILLERAVDDRTLLRELPQPVIDKLTYGLPGLARLQAGVEDWQIGAWLKQALRDWGKIERMRTALDEVGNPRDSIVEKYYRPQDYRLGGLIFDRKPAEPHPVREALARLFDESHEVIETALNDYADAMEARQDTHQSPNEAFNRQIADRFEIEVLPQEWETAEPLPLAEKREIERQRKPKPAVKPETKKEASRLALVPPPGVEAPARVAEKVAEAPREIAARQVETAIADGTITPESLRDFFRSDEKLAPHVDALMDIFARAIPGAHDMPLEQFLAEKLADFRRNPELKQKGVTQFLDDGRALIELGPKADVSTVLHEWFHVMHKYLGAEDQRVIADFVGADDPAVMTREHYEKAARAFEKYLSRGKAPIPEMEGTFARLRSVFRNIYEGIRNSPLATRLSKEMRQTFDRWFGLEPAVEEMKPVPKDSTREVAPPPESLKTISPEELNRAELKIKLNATPLQERMSEARVKSFPALDDAKAWMINNHEALEAGEARQTPEGDVFVHFIPKSPNALFQEEPKTIGEMVRHVERLRKERERQPDPERRRILDREIDRWEGKIGTPTFGLFAPPPEEPKAGLLPPTQGLILFPEESFGSREVQSERAADQRRRAVDDTARILDTARAEGLVSGAERSKPLSQDSASLLGVERAPGRAARVEESRNSLNWAGRVTVDPPQKLRGPSLVNQDQWRARMSDLRMPEGLPAPTYKLKDTTAALLAYPGQREIAEIAMSTLQQYDAAVIATPTGTGKTFTALGVVKESFDPAKDHVLILTTSQEIIRQENGWKDAGKRFFNLEIETMPSDFTKALEPGVYVTTYDTLMRRYNAARYPWKMVIADESDEGRRWWESKTGNTMIQLSKAAEKVLYLSATPFHLVQEYGYMPKLGLWKDQPGKFEEWAKQFGARKTRDGRWIGGNDTKQLLRLRQQLVERGQFITMDKSYDGYSAQFAMVNLTDTQRREMSNAVLAFTEAERWFKMRGQGEKARAVRGVATTYLKSYLERTMLPQTIEMMKEAQKQGWYPQLYVENLASRNELYEFMQPADEAMGGRLSKLLPDLPGVHAELVQAFGEDKVANFTGEDNPKRREELRSHNAGAKPFLLVTYGAGGRGVNTHDRVGTRPRMAFYLGPPWSGLMLDQAVGRPWRYGTKSNVQAVFMSTNAKPHVNMIAGKIAPRLESLRAAVGGVDGTDPLVKAMRSLKGAREELADFSMGGGQKNEIQDFLQFDNRIPVRNYKEIKIDSAEGAKNKGMKYPGEVDDEPGVITLFQEEGELKLPERFVSPEEAKASLLNREMMRSLAEGENVPVAGEELNAITPGERKMLADTVGPVVQTAVEKQGEGDRSAIAREEAGNQMARILAAKRIGDVEATAQGWEMKLPGGVEEEAPKPEEGHVAPLYWLMSGRLNMERVARQANVPKLGKQLKDMHDDYLVRAHNYAGDFAHRFLKILRENEVPTKGEDFRNFWMAKEGLAAPANENVARAVEGVTKLLQEAHKMAADRDIYLKDWDAGKETRIYFQDFTASPNYMPHRYSDTEKIKVIDPDTKEEFSVTWGDLTHGKIPEDRRKMVIADLRRKTGMSIQQMEDWLENRKRRVPLAGNIERARKADMPGYRMDVGSMLDYFHDLGEVLARQEVFGQDREKLDGVISQVPNAKGRQVLNMIFRGLLEPRPMDQRTARFYSLVANAQVLSKMAFSAAKVPGHLALYPVVMEDLGSLTRAIFGAAFNYREMHERAIAAGALAEYTKSASMLEHSASLNLTSKFLSGVGFNWFYKLDRIIANGAARSWMERYALPRLVEKSKRSAHIREQLRNKMLMSDAAIDEAIQRGRWTEQDLNRGSVALTNKTLFTSSPAELGPNWRVRPDDPISENMAQYWRVATILKGFTFKIANAVKEHVIDEARKGNFRPLAYGLISFPAAAEVIRALSMVTHTAVSATTGGGAAPAEKYAKDIEDIFDDPSAGKIIKRYVDDLAFGTAQEVLGNYFDTLLYPSENKRVARYRVKQLVPDTVEWAIGPYASGWEATNTAAQVIGAMTIEEGDKKYQKSAKAILDWGKKEIPVARPGLTWVEEKAGLQAGEQQYPMAR